MTLVSLVCLNDNLFQEELSMNQCDVFWSGKYRQDWEIEPHNHTFFQMIAFSNGSGKIVIGDKSYDIQAGQIYLVQPQQFHSICSSDTDRLHIMDIKFDINSTQLFNSLKEIPTPFIPDDFNWYKKNFEVIINESLSQCVYYYTIICNTLFSMLAHMVRKTKGENDQQQPLYEEIGYNTYNGINVKALMEYIQFNYSKIISLDDLIDIAHTNKTTLTSLFKELFGTTPIKYLNKIRMNKAKELLSNTDISIGEIAELTGFQSIYYFSRYFKTHEAITPVEYRKTNAGNKYFSYN